MYNGQVILFPKLIDADFDVSLTVHLSITFLSEFYYYLFTLISNAANYIIVILDNSLVFRVTIPDAVLIQFDLLRMGKIFARNMYM
jgi:hypothetical protein